MSDQPEGAPALTQEEKRALLARLLKEKAREQVQVAPLSDGQRAMWYIQQSAPENTGYNVNMAMRICEPLNVDHFQKAVQAVVNRHASLRTTYLHVEDQPVQQIHRYQDADFSLVDAAGWSEAELHQQVMRVIMQPFDLENGPVARWRLFRVTPQNFVFSASFHHIAVDGLSFALILDDLRKALRALQEGQPIALGPEPEAYTNWAAWQQQMLASSAGQTHRDYWMEQLAGELPMLSLPYDFPHPPIQTYRGDSLTFTIPAGATAQLRSLAQSSGVTPFALLVAVYQLLLHRYTGQPEILVGTPTAGRGHPDFQKTIGYFVNPVVLRSTLEGVRDFRAYLNRVKTTVLNALAHQDYPFIRTVENLRLHRDPSRSPVFQCTFNLINARLSHDIPNLANPAATKITGDFAGLQIESYFIPLQEGAFELTLEVLDTDEEFICVLHYHTDLFRRATAERIAASYQMLLEQVLANPDIALSDLDVLTPDERRRVLVDWNQTQADYPRDVCLHQPFEAQVERTPNAIAIEFENETLTYAQLNARANQLAHFLLARGVQPNTMIGICMERSLEMAVAIYGVLKAGAAYVAIEPGYPAERIAWMIADSNVALLISHSPALSNLPETSVPVLSLNTDWAQIAAQPHTNPALALSPENLVYMIYTSGSTGAPKGAILSHRAVVNQIFWVLETFPISANDVVIQKAPFTFDASVWEFNAPLYTGAKLLVAQPGGHQDGIYMVETIRQKKVTSLKLVPSLLQLLLETPGFEECTSLRYVFSGGEPLPMTLVRQFYALLPDAQLFNCYGPTETAVDVTWWRCDPAYKGGWALMGRPVANTQAYILDANLQPTPIGVPGELHIGGVQVGNGYHNRPDLTAARFIPDPFSRVEGARLYKTGDLVRYSPDGMIEYIGRGDSQVKIRGHRIELGEIEAVLTQHPGVQQAVVTVREDTPSDRRLTAYWVASAAGTPPSAREVRNFLKDRLPGYMLPTHFIQMDSLPLTSSGKVNRLALPAPTKSVQDGQDTRRAPVTPMEQTLAESWMRILNVTHVSTLDNFFDLGGHSLLAMRLVLDIQQKTGQRIEPGYLRFESLGQLAARLDEATARQT